MEESDCYLCVTESISPKCFHNDVRTTEKGGVCLVCGTYQSPKEIVGKGHSGWALRSSEGNYGTHSLGLDSIEYLESMRRDPFTKEPECKLE